MQRSQIKLVFIPLFSLMLLSAPAHAKISCWTNSDGVRECGNAVPPEYAQKETRTINDRGRTTEVKERAKTQEEIAAAKALRDEEKRLAAVEAKRKKKQDAYDRVLLSTYLVENDIIRSRDRQSGSFDATIEVTNTTIKKLQDKLNAERKRAADFERKGKKIPTRIQQEIATLQEQIQDKNSFIQRHEQEKMLLHKKYDADMIRFRELKANNVKLQ